MQPLPIDAVLADVVAATREGASVLVAPPGAGKTTRVPGAILDAGLGDVVVLEPRRLAARMAAARVAAERGVRLGAEVGYEVRFDRKAGADTRIRFVTEGLLARRMIDDPTLRGVGVVVIDEFHERHLAGDVALARVRALAPRVRVVVMSATIDPAPVARFLGARVIVSEGRTFPVDVEYLGDKPVASGLRHALATGLDGDVLVFLPGAAEIRRAAEDCAELAARHDLSILPLHGDLSADEQDRAVAPSSRRKLILSTNVAETSVTIDGVTCVIDAGTARVARHSPWSGLPQLLIEPISKASAAQRAGRAGRTRPGRALRLYDKHDHDTRRDFDAPEVARADLAEVALELHAAGVAHLADFGWFEPPPAAAVAAADQLLARLGAIDDRGALTDVGRRMLRLPAHPRQARIVVEAERRGAGAEGAMLAAILGARELRVERRMRKAATLAAPSDLLEDLELMHAARADRMRPGVLRDLGLDVAGALGVDRAARQLEQQVARGRNEPSDDDLCAAILAGYPDRVGKRRAPRSAEVVFAGGGSGTLSPSSVVVDDALMVAVDAAETGRNKVQIRRASRIDPTWLLELFPDRVTDVDEVRWLRDRHRVERVRGLAYDGLTIDEAPGDASDDPRAAALLAREAVAAGVERFVDADALAQWRARIAFVATHAPELGLAAPSDEHLLTGACAGLTSFDELRKVDLLARLADALAGKRAAVERLAPTSLALPGRRRAPIHYELDRAPWVASRLQDFFGMRRTPAVADGRVPLVLHLLAPNQRAVQVTQDLDGFWTKHYPAIRKELARKYPRHAWPDDPRG